MAKELPYYKFEPNEWENGNIQICTHEQKGVFIDLCSMYWARLGDVPYKLAVQKICGGNANALDSLLENQIFEIIDGNIYIKFLSEQLNEFENTSERNSKIARDGWEKRRKQKEVSEGNANAMRTQSEGNAIREDKSRVDKIKEDKIITINDVYAYFELSGYRKEVAEKFYNYYDVAGWRDAKGNKVKNWKQKAQAVWFKDENKIGKKKYDPSDPNQFHG